jgi:hypothetical protein
MREYRAESERTPPVFPFEWRELPVGVCVELLQLVNNLRPVAEFEYTRLSQERLRSILERLSQYGFSVVHKNLEDERTCYFVSKFLPLAEEAALLVRRDGSVVDHHRFGQLMGFPETAIQAFLKGRQALLTSIEAEEKLGFEEIMFAFRLSREHYEEEIEYLRKCNRCLLEQAPFLIDDLLAPHDAARYKEEVKRFVYGSRFQDSHHDSSSNRNAFRESEAEIHDDKRRRGGG